jgi:uncharacterized protein Yka (UPF0111/DUF47 family)
MANNTFWERLFPVKYDFYGMISEQAKATTDGVKILCNWIRSRAETDHQLLFQRAETADQIRFDMEHKLIEAFVTPFDRQDIYSLSIEMDRILVYAKSTLLEMEAFAVFADKTIIEMVQQLSLGTDLLTAAIDLLKEEPLQSQNHIGKIRKVQQTIEDNYRTGMVELFNGVDLIHAMKYREVYHHIKDAATHLGYTTDVLHKIVVRII